MSTNQKELLEKHEEWQDTIEVKPEIKTNIKMRVAPKQLIEIGKIKPICKSFTNAKYIFIYKDGHITWSNKKYEFDKKETMQEVDADLFIRTNGTCIEKEEFTYPMWFRHKFFELGYIARFDSLTTGEIIPHQNWVLDYYICDNLTPHTDTAIWERVEEPKNIIDELAYISGLSKEDIRLKAVNMFKEREIIIQERMKQYTEDIKNGEKPFLDFNKLLEEREKENHNEHYKKQKIDTIARCKANMTLEQQKAICIFNCDKYLHREKGQNLSDIQKVRYYLDWLEEIENKLKEEK